LDAFGGLHLGRLDGDAVEAHQGRGEGALHPPADGLQVLAESHQRAPRLLRIRSSSDSSRAICSPAGGPSCASFSRAAGSPSSANRRKISRARPASPCFRYSSASVSVMHPSTQGAPPVSSLYLQMAVVSWLVPSQA